MENGGTAAGSLDRATDGEVVDSDDETPGSSRHTGGSFERIVCQKVDLIVERKDENAPATTLKGTAAVRNAPEEGKWRAIIFDPETNGETVTTPWRRFPPLKQGLLMRSIQSALTALASDAYTFNPDELAIGDKDLYMFC